MARRRPRSCSASCPRSRSPSCSSAIWSRAWRSAGRRAEETKTREIPMRRFWSATSVALLLGGFVTIGWLTWPDRAPAARPYEGQTIRAVVNAEFVKYSLTLIEQDLYDKLGVKLETEVSPADAFVAKTLLEFNGGGSPWDLVMFGPSNMPDYGRHFEPLEPWIEKLKLDFAMDDIVPVFAKVMLRYQGKLVSMPYDGDIHIMYWNKPAFERAENKAKFKAKYKYDLQPPKTWKQWDDAAESGIVGKAGFGLLPGADIDGKIVNRPAITPGRGMAVSKYSKKKEVTMKVLEFISNPDQSLKIVMDAKTIMDPWRVSHLRSEKFRKLFPDADKYLDAIQQSFPYLVPDPVIPAADEYQRKLSFEITEALAKRKAPKDALDSAAKEWDKITERRGPDKQKAAWGEKLAEMKQLGIEYHADWAAKAK